MMPAASVYDDVDSVVLADLLLRTGTMFRRPHAPEAGMSARQAPALWITYWFARRHAGQ